MFTMSRNAKHMAVQHIVLSAALALAGLLGLAGSFAADVAWLARHARDSPDMEVSRC